MKQINVVNNNKQNSSKGRGCGHGNSHSHHCSGSREAWKCAVKLFGSHCNQCKLVLDSCSAFSCYRRMIFILLIRGTCNNCGTNHPPRKCKAFGKECYHCHKKGHFSHSKQRGRNSSVNSKRNQNQNNRNSKRDFHVIESAKYDDQQFQFEQDSGN